MKTILLTKGKVAKVDDSDYDWLNSYKWHCHSKGYAGTYIDGRVVLMHRLIMETPEGMDTDHLNHDRADNRRDNLRVCTHAENMKNTPLHHNYNPNSALYFKPYKTNKSGVGGIHWEANAGKWRLRIQLDNKRKDYGLFDNLDEAVAMAKFIRQEA